jgi:hypothetical protein
MSKRTSMDKIPKDFYPTTDPNALTADFRRLIAGKSYGEPCCGNGDLINLIGDLSYCEWASDSEVRPKGVQQDAMDLTEGDLRMCDLIITNPPFTRKVLLPMIDHLISLKPTWLLLPADMMHNKYFGSYMDKCCIVASIGRLKWFVDSPHTSTDNFAWYYWTKNPVNMRMTQFYGRS